MSHLGKTINHGENSIELLLGDRETEYKIYVNIEPRLCRHEKGCVKACILALLLVDVASVAVGYQPPSILLKTRPIKLALKCDNCSVMSEVFD